MHWLMQHKMCYSFQRQLKFNYVVYSFIKKKKLCSLLVNATTQLNLIAEVNLQPCETLKWLTDYPYKVLRNEVVEFVGCQCFRQSDWHEKAAIYRSNKAYRSSILMVYVNHQESLFFMVFTNYALFFFNENELCSLCQNDYWLTFTIHIRKRVLFLY
jgi:hypothetical protein